jgi:hypothetical protein
VEPQLSRQRGDLCAVPQAQASQHLFDVMLRLRRACHQDTATLVRELHCRKYGRADPELFDDEWQLNRIILRVQGFQSGSAKTSRVGTGWPAAMASPQASESIPIGKPATCRV